MLHDDCSDGHDFMQEREMLRSALVAAGNPPCRLRDVLMLCETCDGSCGIELWPSGFCGERAVESMLEEMVDMVCKLHGETIRWGDRMSDI